MKNSPRIWIRADWITALIAFAISFGVYFWSAAPNVTLLDSGEFVVAAEHFGVPHPTGYPLWTIICWLFHLLPFGNSAWEINLCSGVCAALAVGLTAALLSSIQRWCFVTHLTGIRQWLPQIVALAFSLMLAFSESMWSQAVIAEVYALHALMVANILIVCYMWVRQPARDGLLMLVFFLLALGFSNHHLILALPLAGIPYLLILLLRRRMFFDWLFAGLLTVLMAYLGFAILSGEQPVLKTAIRFTYFLIPALGIFIWMRRFRVRWRFIAFLPFVVALGLLPYLYMPFASSTNPPMNWSYAREPQGFFYSLNRSQYSGSLSDLSLKSLGRLMGTNPNGSLTKPPRPKVAPTEIDFTLKQKLRLWIGFFWMQILRNFSPIALIGYFASILFVFRFSLDKRVWIYLLHFTFIFAAFVQPMGMDPWIDNDGWWLQMPFHTYTYLIFATLSGLGIGMIIERLNRRRAVLFWLAPMLLILPIFTFRNSEPQSTQRDRWFGWMYGHDMLKDLPKGSIMIGGTDAGRFVPTYMIFGESFEPAKHKRDPDFDRRDLYIITQNALGEPNYMKYLRDQYTTARPEPRTAIERWLGRAEAYPKDPIELPTSEEIEEALKKAAKDGEAEKESPDTLVFATTLKWIWEKNRDKHEFFIEESFPMKWTYDYAVPAGLVYRLNKTKLDALSEKDVQGDFDFWKDYKAKLLGNPSYKDDLDAQRSFSQLRQTMGNIYQYRKMDKEAERAYREALELWPGNPKAIYSIASYMEERGEYDGIIEMLQTALNGDPNNLNFMRLLTFTENRKEADGEISSLVAKLKDQPKSRDTLRKLIELYGSLGETNKAQPFIQRALQDFPEDADLLREIIKYHEVTGQLPKTLLAAEQLAKIESSNVNNQIVLAHAYFFNDKKKEFYEIAEKAIKLGGDPVRQGFAQDPKFAPWREEPEYQKLIEPPSVLPQTKAP